MVEGALLEVAERRIMGVDFVAKEMARRRLHIPTTLKEVGIRNITVLKQPTFVVAILDFLPRCIERNDDNGDIVKGVYTK